MQKDRTDKNECSQDFSGSTKLQTLKRIPSPIKCNIQLRQKRQKVTMRQCYMFKPNGLLGDENNRPYKLH